MADAEIQILITAIDEMSGTMKRIEGQLEKSNKIIQKQSEVTSKTFVNQIKTLQALGNIASSVSNIFDTYERAQLRLENASIRVEESQKNLNELMTSGKATTEQIQSATNSLTIAQNNLQRSHIAMNNAYLNMGIQIISVTKSMYDLIKANIAFLATPTGIALVVIATAIATIAYVTNSYISAVNNLKKATADVANETDTWARALANVKAQMMGFIIPQTAEEKKALYDVAVQQGKVTEAKQYDATVHSELTAIELQNEAEKLSQLQLQYEHDFTNRRNIAQAFLDWQDTAKQEELGLNKDITEKTYTLYHQSYSNIEKYLKEIYAPAVLTEHQRIADEKVRIEQEAADKVNAIWSSVQTGGLIGGISTSVIGKKYPTSLLGGTSLLSKITGMKDFIMRPGQEAVNFSPNDTIVGYKGGNGMGRTTVIIEGNIYGVDADDIAEALQKQLNKRLSMGN